MTRSLVISRSCAGLPPIVTVLLGMNPKPLIRSLSPPAVEPRGGNTESMLTAGPASCCWGWGGGGPVSGKDAGPDDGG